MPTDAVSYELNDAVATIRIDDGKRNALSPAILEALYSAFDRANHDGAAVILTGRETVFSAGFDLNVMKKGGTNALRMLRAGYGLTAHVMAHPHPVVVACNGHAMAMGVFLMLSADYVVGSRGDFRIAANEVAIGLPMPRVAAAMLKHRLTPAAYQRAVTLSECFDVDSALKTGFFDDLVEPDLLMQRAMEHMAEFRKLPAGAHAAAKKRIRAALIRQIKVDIWRDLFDAVMLGVRGGGPRT
jgi:enoyl-CoA hydratase